MVENSDLYRRVSGEDLVDENLDLHLIEDSPSDHLGGMVVTRAFTAEKQPMTILVGQLGDQAVLSGVLELTRCTFPC
ncbi:hypothetical protein ACFL7E_00305 [Thermodesulfobacteriota bacterium]